MYSKPVILTPQAKQKFEKNFLAIGTSIFDLRYKYLGSTKRVFLYSRLTQLGYGFEDFIPKFLRCLTCTQQLFGIK
jgi:hypothetical protein